MAEFTLVAIEKERKHPGSMGSGGAFAQSYSLFNVSWALGSITGSNFAGEISKYAGWGTMGWSFAILCSIAFITAVLFCGGWIGTKPKLVRRWFTGSNSTEHLV